jgi:hypothetical protein
LLGLALTQGLERSLIEPLRLGDVGASRSALLEKSLEDRDRAGDLRPEPSRGSGSRRRMKHLAGDLLFGQESLLDHL